MNIAYLKLIIVVGILITNLYDSKCTLTNVQGRSLADNYTALTEDVKWFFRGVSKFANTVDRMLPNVTTELSKTSNFSENTRITLLIGLRHLLVGVREISLTFEKSFNTDHVKELCHLKAVAKFVSDVINYMKVCFSQIRALVMHFLFLYNRYFPEVLFGKCLGHYLVTTYPERYFYEYPVILLSEIYSSFITNLDAEPNKELSSEFPRVGADLNVEQNEISDLEDTKSSYGPNSTHQPAANSTELSQSSEGLFDISTVLSLNKEKIIESAANEHSWQICFKLYTAESISRSLKIYFLGI